MHKSQNSTRIVLNSLIGGTNISIIPHFIKYYKCIGVDDFYITVNVPDGRYDILMNILDILDIYSIKPLNIWIGHFNNHIKGCFMKSATEKCLKDDWILRADQDEFADFEIELKDMVKKCEENGHLYIEGVRIERMTSDGTLPIIEEESDIFQLFPVKCLIKKGYGYWARKKIVLSKREVKVHEGGFHGLDVDSGVFKSPDILDINHFRWGADILADWERRILTFPKKVSFRKRKQMDFIFKDKKTINMKNIKILK